MSTEKSVSTQFQKGKSGNPSGKKTGKNPSFKKRYREIQQQEGIVWTDEGNTHKRTYNGKKQIGFQFEKIDSLLARLDTMIKSKKNTKISFDAIKFLWEQTDGRAKQSVEMIEPEREQYDYSKLTVEENKNLLALLEKARVSG